MKNVFNRLNQTKLKDNLYFAGTIYDSFEALEEVLGKLKLERPLFLLYLAKKAFAEEVIAVSEKDEKMPEIKYPYAGIILNNNRQKHLQ